MFGIMVVVITARFGTSSEVYQPGEVSEADEFFEFQREVSSMNCLCRGLSAGRAVSGLDLAALDAELTALAKVDSAVAARRSLVAAEVKRRRSDPADRLTKAGGMSSREANRAAKTAEGLEKLSKTREALAAGEISKGQAEQLASRMNKPALAKHVRANEEALLERARGESTDEFARTMRKDDLDGSPDGGNTQARCQRRARMASMWIDPDTGMHHLFAKFDPVTGARVSTRLQAMVDKLWRAENLAGGVRNKRQVDQRRADALETLICQSAGTSTSTSTGTGTGTNTSKGTSTSKGDQVDPHSGSTPNDSTPNDSTPTNDTGAVPTPDHTLPTAQAPLPPPPNHTQLLVIANLDLLSQQLGAGTLEDGTPLPIDTIARLACDAEIIPAIFGAKGQPLWLGRRTRLATSAQRLAVTARDLGCIVCHASPEFCQVHHITWWSAGGGTDLDNLCIVCSRHHTMIHEQGLTIAKTPDGMKVQPPPARAFRMVTQPPDGTGDPPLDTQQPNRSQQPDTRQPDTRQRPGSPQRLSRQSPGGPPRDATAA